MRKSYLLCDSIRNATVNRIILISRLILIYNATPIVLTSNDSNVALAIAFLGDLTFSMRRNDLALIMNLHSEITLLFNKQRRFRGFGKVFYSAYIFNIFK